MHNSRLYSWQIIIVYHVDQVPKRHCQMFPLQSISAYYSNLYLHPQITNHNPAHCIFCTRTKNMLQCWYWGQHTYARTTYLTTPWTKGNLYDLQPSLKTTSQIAHDVFKHWKIVNLVYVIIRHKLQQFPTLLNYQTQTPNSNFPLCDHFHSYILIQELHLTPPVKTNLLEPTTDCHIPSMLPDISYKYMPPKLEPQTSTFIPRQPCALHLICLSLVSSMVSSAFKPFFNATAFSLRKHNKRKTCLCFTDNNDTYTFGLSSSTRISIQMLDAATSLIKNTTSTKLVFTDNNHTYTFGLSSST
jgi:hypothetical protein